MGIEPKPVIDPRTAYLTSKLLREIVTTGHSAPIRATKVLAAGKTGTSSRTSDVWFIGYTSRWMATAWIGDDKYERQLGYKDASFMLSVPMWARFMYDAVGDQPLEEIPWERPARVKAHDIGGPLKKEFPPPPLPGFDVSGKPIEPPDKLKEQLHKQQTHAGRRQPRRRRWCRNDGSRAVGGAGAAEDWQRRHQPSAISHQPRRSLSLPLPKLKADGRLQFLAWHDIVGP